MKMFDKKDYLYILLLFLCNFFWFHHLKNGALMGDDIIYVLMGMNAGNKLQFIFENASSLKYRPVLNSIQVLSVNCFGNHYYFYFLLNLFVNFIAVVIFYKYSLSISDNKNKIFALGLCLISCRFIYYNIMQVLGIMEGLCLCFLGLALLNLSKFYKEGKQVALGKSLIWISLLVFTHERFLAVLPLYMAVVLFSNARYNKKKCIAVVSIPFATNLLIKRYVFNFNPFQGTAGVPIHISGNEILKEVFWGASNSFGIDLGLPFWHGYTFANYSEHEKEIAIIILFIMLMFIFRYLFYVLRLQNGRKKKEEIKKAGFFLLLYTMLLLSISVTVRQEMRWFTSLYILLLVMILYIANINCMKTRVWKALFIIFIIGNVFLGLRYQRKIQIIYFANKMSLARNVYENTIGKYGDELSEKDLMFYSKSKDWQWLLAGTGERVCFFDVYAPTVRARLLHHFELDGVSKPYKTFILNQHGCFENNNLTGSEMLED